MHRARFASFLLIGFGALLGFLFLFPAIVSFVEQGMIHGRDCQDPEAGCAAMADRIARFLKPLGIVAISGYLIWVLQQRISLLEFGSKWTAIGSLWLLGSIPPLVSAHNFWSADFSLGFLYIPLPFLLAYFLAFTSFLYAVKYAPDRAPDKRQNRAWKVVLVVTIVTLVLSAQSILIGLQMVPYLGAIVDPKLQLLVGRIAYYARLGVPLSIFQALGFMVLSGTLAYIILCQNRTRGAIATRSEAEGFNAPDGKALTTQPKRFGQRKTA